jgi:LysM repeat protein
VQSNKGLRDLFGATFLAGMLAWLLMAPAVNADGSLHTVQPGETLRRIAESYGVSVEELAAANQIVNPNLIFAGQVLVIPATAENDGAAAMDETGEVQVQEPVVHVVQPGETLTRIAARYGVTTAEIVRLNRLGNPNLIFTGQRLQIAGNGDTAGGEPAQPASKRIVVDKSDQRAYVYEGGELLWTFVVSTGMPGSDTWEGTFAVRSKIPNAYAQLWSLQMPYWLGFYHTGYLENGFHALPIMPSGTVLWDGYLGTPVSYGCVILSYPDAKTLYEWAEIGTEVIVQP